MIACQGRHSLGLPGGRYAPRDRQDSGLWDRLNQKLLDTIDFDPEWQSIYVDYSGKLQRAQIDPVQ